VYNRLSSSESLSRGLRSTRNVFVVLISPVRCSDDNEAAPLLPSKRMGTARKFPVGDDGCPFTLLPLVLAVTEWRQENQQPGQAGSMC